MYTSFMSTVMLNMCFRIISPLDDPGKTKLRCTPRGTKVVIYHLVGNFMLNSMQNKNTKSEKLMIISPCI